VNLERLGKYAGALLSIIALTSTLGGLAGVLLWKLWLADKVRVVVREEVADIRVSVAKIAGALTAPDSTKVLVGSEEGYGPAPR